MCVCVWVCLCVCVYNCIVQFGILPWEIQVAFHRESQLWQLGYQNYGVCMHMCVCMCVCGVYVCVHLCFTKQQSTLSSLAKEEGQEFLPCSQSEQLSALNSHYDWHYSAIPTCFKYHSRSPCTTRQHWHTSNSGATHISLNLSARSSSASFSASAATCCCCDNSREVTFSFSSRSRRLWTYTERSASRKALLSLKN